MVRILLTRSSPQMYPVAFNYGKTTETWIGNWLAARVGGGTVKREDLYFATKCNPLGTGGTVGKQGKWKKHAFDADRLRASCEASLSRLRCDYIDLYMLHFPSRMGGEAFGWANWKDGRYDAARTSTGAEADFEAQVRAVKGLFDANLIRHWALSNETAYGVTMFCLTCDRLGVPRPVSVQNDFNFNNRTFETSCAEACHHLGVVGMPYGALGGGALTGKYQAVWKSTSVSGAPDNSSLSHFSAMTRPSWLGRAVRNEHHHAIEQASRRWRGGRRNDSARTRSEMLISTQTATAVQSATGLSAAQTTFAPAKPVL